MQIKDSMSMPSDASAASVASTPSTTVDRWLHSNKINRVGMVTLDLNGKQETARLQLNDDWLSLTKEEIAYTYSPVDKIDPVVLTKERTVHIRREKVGGLGLSVKGGAEHNLPILISRIFKDQAADKTGRLFVGDAILKVNSVKLDHVQHDEAVQCLKRAGEVAALTVKYFRPASLFLSQRRSGCHLNGDATLAITDDVFQPEQQWTEIVSMNLLCAYITKYVPGTDEPRSCGIEVVSMEGRTSGAIYVDNTKLQAEWIQNITSAITCNDAKFIKLFNRNTVQEQHLKHMCWVCERHMIADPSTSSAQPTTWFKQFLTFRGSDVCLYDNPPVKDKNWRNFNASYKIYECMFRILKNDELEDDRTFCFVIETGSGSIHYLSVETRQAILQLENAWNWVNFNAIRQLKSKTYRCSSNGRVCGITLDFDTGFALYDSEEKNYVWNYKFSQLKSSSDNGSNRLRLHFLSKAKTPLETRELECGSMRTFMFAVQAFLCASLAKVDKTFLHRS